MRTSERAAMAVLAAAVVSVVGIVSTNDTNHQDTTPRTPTTERANERPDYDTDQCVEDEVVVQYPHQVVCWHWKGEGWRVMRP
jgi:hypothetical protein